MRMASHQLSYDRTATEAAAMAAAAVDCKEQFIQHSPAWEQVQSLQRRPCSSKCSGVSGHRRRHIISIPSPFAVRRRHRRAARCHLHPRCCSPDRVSGPYSAVPPICSRLSSPVHTAEVVRQRSVERNVSVRGTKARAANTTKTTR